MKMNKRGTATEGSGVAAHEDEILRIDLEIQGMRKIKSIPIELGGVRSFLYDFSMKKDNPLFIDNTEHTLNQAEKLAAPQYKLAIICKVKFENSKKDVEFQSSLLFSNNSQFDITIVGVSPGKGALQNEAP